MNVQHEFRFREMKCVAGEIGVWRSGAGGGFSLWQDGMTKLAA